MNQDCRGVPIIKSADWSAANMVILITSTIGIKVLFEPILLYTDNLYTDTTSIGTSYSYMIDDSFIIIISTCLYNYLW